MSRLHATKSSCGCSHVPRYRVIVAVVRREYRSEQLLSAQRHPVGWQGQACTLDVCDGVDKSPHPDSVVCMSERALVCFVHACGTAIRRDGSTVSLNTNCKASTGATDVTTRSSSFSSIQRPPLFRIPISCTARPATAMASSFRFGASTAGRGCGPRVADRYAVA
jgi:hypothetical protein